jgi:Gylcosyl hydrolase family 115 C-terminal domain
VQCAVQKAVDGQVSPLIGVGRSQFFVEIDAQTGRFAGMHIAVLKSISVRKYSVGLCRVRHVFLNAKVMDTQIEVKRRQADRTQIEASRPAEPKPDQLGGFVAGNGYVSIEAVHYTKKVDGPSARWEKIDDLGRTLSAMTVFPVTVNASEKRRHSGRFWPGPVIQSPAGKDAVRILN